MTQEKHPKPRADGRKDGKPVRTPSRPWRNNPCPCGSGKKYKLCCKDIRTLAAKLLVVNKF